MYSNKIRNHFMKFCAKTFAKKRAIWPNSNAYISFTFDDFPRSSCLIGAEILSKYNIKATYFVSIGLMGKKTIFWSYFTHDDLLQLITNDHEIGSHTYDHIDAWKGGCQEFEDSIRKNQEEMKQIQGNYIFKTFSYCSQQPNPRNKKIAEKYFLCCRGGDNKINLNILDLNLLSSFFIDKYYRDRINYIKNIVDYNAAKKGWLIFSTHDISDNPSPFGCKPETFEQIVKISRDSGATILPILNVYEEVFALKKNAL